MQNYQTNMKSMDGHLSSILKREEFAVNLRRQKRQKLISKKRLSIQAYKNDHQEITKITKDLETNLKNFCANSESDEKFNALFE